MKKSIFAIVILLLFCGFLGFDAISALVLYDDEEADPSGETSPTTDTSVKDRETMGFHQTMKNAAMEFNTILSVREEPKMNVL